MTDCCPGWELEAEDHRVLAQLSRLTKATSGRISSGQPRQLAMRLHIDEAAWLRHISELKHCGYIEDHDGLLYLNQRCTCEQAEGLPPVGAKSREPLHQGPVKGPGWGKLPSSRQERRPQGARNVRAEGTNPFPPVGGEGDLQATAITTTSNTDAQTEVRAKRKGTLHAAPRHITSEPDAKPPTTIAALRRSFRDKWVTADVCRKKNIEATRVLDDERTGAFRLALKSMKQAGITSERIEAMMDMFMDMVLSGEIPIDGKPVWRVFLTKRQVLIERIDRTRRLGDGRDVIRNSSVARSKKLDRLRDGDVEPGSPNERR